MIAHYTPVHTPICATVKAPKHPWESLAHWSRLPVSFQGNKARIERQKARVQKPTGSESRTAANGISANPELTRRSRETAGRARARAPSQRSMTDYAARPRAYCADETCIRR